MASYFADFIQSVLQRGVVVEPSLELGPCPGVGINCLDSCGKIGSGADGERGIEVGGEVKLFHPVGIDFSNLCNGFLNCAGKVHMTATRSDFEVPGWFDDSIAVERS